MYKITIFKNDTEILKREINSQICRIGRNPFSEIILDEPYISYEHLIIVELFGHFFAIDKSLNGILYNGKKLKRDFVQYIGTNPVLSISNYSIKLEKPEADYYPSKTMILFNNIKNGIELKDVILIENQDNIIRSLLDDDFEVKELSGLFFIAEIYKDDIKRIVSFESKHKNIYAIIFSHSRYYKYSFDKKNKKRYRLGWLDIIVTFILISIFIFSISLLLVFLFYK